MSNIGFISKKKLLTFDRIYEEYSKTRATKEEIMRDREVQSALDLLCEELNLTRNRKIISDDDIPTVNTESYWVKEEI